MAFEKRYTARQVAEAVMAKTQELLTKSELAKKQDEMEKCGTFSKVHAAARREGYSEQSADKIAGKAKAMEKAENSKKENAKPSEHGAKEQDQPANGPAPKGEIHPKEHVEGKSDDVRHTPNPEANPKEQAEGNNELAGTTPTQVGQDGKNVPGGDEIKGHLKLAKFIGHMESKRKHRGIPNG
jgi:hypothetical protein